MTSQTTIPAITPGTNTTFAALKQIDAAFLPINDSGRGIALRTMNPAMFADAVKAVRPKILFPYNYGNNDPKAIADLVKDEQGIDLRVRDMK